MDNKEAHNIHSTTLGLFDLYNQNNFSHIKEVNELYLLWANDGLKLFKFLHEKEPCKATEMNLLYTGKLIMRLSSLIHNGRIENDNERSSILDIYKPKNGWKYIYMEHL